MRRKLVDGVTLGSAGRALREPPPPPPPVTLRRRPVGSHGLKIDEVVRRMVVAFRDDSGPRRARAVLERMDGPWHGVLRRIAADLMDEGISPRAFVLYVCDGVRRLRGRAPFAGEVFSLEGARGWLPGYHRAAASFLELPGYAASPERRRAWSDWMAACRSPATS